MIGSDFSEVGSKWTNALHSFRAGTKIGPIKVCFIGKSLIVIDDEHSIYAHDHKGKIEKEILCRSLKDQIDDVAEYFEIEKENENEVDISASCVCYSRSTDQVLVADFEQSSIQFFSSVSWTVHRLIENCSSASFKSITGIDSFRIGKDNFLCITEASSNRLSILDFDGVIVFRTGERKGGMSVGSLSDPLAVSCFFDSKKYSLVEDAAAASSPSFYPNWYLGFGNADESETKLRSDPLTTHRSFFITRRKSVNADDQSRIFDLVYVIERSDLQGHCFSYVREELKAVDSAATRDHSAGVYFIQNKKKYPTLLEYVRDQTHLKKCDETRPFVTIAVAEKGNKRVQIFRYFWAYVPFLYKPNVEIAHVVGSKGKRKWSSSTVDDVLIQYPVSLSYSRTGELAICDSQLSRVYILSPLHKVIKYISLSYHDPVLQAKRLSRTAHSQNHHESDRKIATEEVHPDSEKDANSHDKSASHTRLEDRATTQLMAANTCTSKFVEGDNQCCSVSFGSDGKLAIGYKSGGVVIYAPYKSSRVGELVILPLSSLERLLGYCNYEDVCALRNSCVFLHDFTRRQRSLWRVFPLRRNFHDFAIFAFISYARTISGENLRWKCKDVTVGRKQKANSYERLSVDRSLAAVKLVLALKAAAENANAAVSVLPSESNIVGANDSVPPSTSELDANPIEEEDPSQLRDVHGKLMCLKYLRMICGDSRCTSSHGSLHLNVDQLRRDDGVMDYLDFIVAASNLFGSHHIWRVDNFLAPLFEAYSTKRFITIRKERGRYDNMPAVFERNRERLEIEVNSPAFAHHCFAAMLPCSTRSNSSSRSIHLSRSAALSRRVERPHDLQEKERLIGSPLQTLSQSSSMGIVENFSLFSADDRNSYTLELSSALSPIHSTGGNMILSKASESVSSGSHGNTYGSSRQRSRASALSKQGPSRLSEARETIVDMAVSAVNERVLLPDCRAIREEEVASTKVLSLKSFMDIMLVLEEDFQLCKPIYEHPIFKKMKILPTMKQMHEPYDSMRADGRMYRDPLEQYNRGLGFVSTSNSYRPKTRVFQRKLANVMGEEKVNPPPGNNDVQACVMLGSNTLHKHNQVIDSHSMKAAAIIENLFK